MKYPANNTGGTGEQVAFTYLAQGTLNSVIGDNTYVQSTAYDTAGKVINRILSQASPGPLLQQAYVYFPWSTANGLGRLKRITAGTASAPTLFLDLQYYNPANEAPYYDANGNPSQINDYKMGSPQTQSFTYDDLNRLTSASAAGGSDGNYQAETYAYNASTGNSSSKAGVSLLYDAQRHLPGWSPDQAPCCYHRRAEFHCYDRTATRCATWRLHSPYNLTYDAENRLTGVTGERTALILSTMGMATG